VATDPTKIRSVALIGQGGVGKTSTADALAFAAGANNRLGRVDDESSMFDTEPEETRRRCTITSSVAALEWNKHSVYLVDTPGQGNFVLDASFAMRGVGAVVLVLDPSSSLRAETSKVVAWAKAEGLPMLAFVNRIDRPEVKVDGIVEALASTLGLRPTFLQLPLGTSDAFNGVVDLLTNKALVYGDASGKFKTEDVPAALVDRAAELRNKLMEDAAEGADELLEKYLEAGELSDQEIVAGLRAAVRAGTILPVLCGSAAKNIGLPQLLDAIVSLVPAPAERGAEKATDSHGKELTLEPDPAAPFSGFVFKTIMDPQSGQLSVMRVMSGKLSGETPLINTKTDAKERVGHVLQLQGRKILNVESATVGEIVALAKLKDTHAGSTLADAGRPVTIRSFPHVNPVISFALSAKKRGEEDKATLGLHKLAEEDLALHVDRDEESAEILVSGSGQLHVETACERLHRKYGVEVELKAPKVPYRETIRKSTKAHGRLKKQTGGHGQFADCWIEVEPLPRGGGFQFEDNIVGGVIPRNFIPAVEKGVRDALKKGTIAGYPVVDVKVSLYDGQYHDVDSSEMAFKIAGSMAFKAAMDEAKPVLLEPIVTLDVSVPDDCMGDVMGDLNSRRGKVEGMTQIGSNQVIKAKVPMSEVLRYAPDLTSMTSGRGSFEIAFSHYEQMPDHLVQKVAAEAQKSQAGA
jgi:elongation factor G